MGIKYLEDLSLDEFLEALNFNWQVTEKIDGCYFEFGLDNFGKFFTKKKGGKPCYTLSDWEDIYWYNSFRQAHVVAQNIVEVLQSNQLLSSGQSISSEIIFELRTNTISYGRSCVLCLTGFPNDALYYECLSLLRGHAVKVNEPVWYSIDGITISRYDTALTWSVIVVPKHPVVDLEQAFGEKLRQIEEDVMIWLNSESKLTGYTNRQILETKFNKCPSYIPKKQWVELKPKIKAEKPFLEVTFFAFKKAIFNIIMNSYILNLRSVVGNSPIIEGLVVRTTTGLLFKTVDRDTFSKANKFTHRINCAMLGGRRPDTSSFLSRTADWSQIRRVKRLDRIVLWYLENHSKIQHKMFIGRNTYILTYDKILHYRTLLMFAILRKRILDGWYGL